MDKEIQFRRKYNDGMQFKLNLLGVTLWASNHFNKSGWFRLFGIGITWKHESLGLLFSERNGYKKYLKIGKWVIGYLPYRKLILNT